MRLNIARVLIGLVILWNVQAAMAFLLWPERFVAAYELEGFAGAAALRGIGVLFLMWNIPYLVALWHPVRFRVSLFEALAMQSIGLIGEGIIYLTLASSFSVLKSSVSRFILFDAVGLLLLVIAFWITRAKHFDR